MMPTDTHNRQVVLKRRPVGAPTVDDFAMVEGPIPEPGDGEVLTRALWLSLDPYMRGRMSGRKSYAPSVPLGGVMVARTVSRVIESRDPGFAPGDIVLGPVVGVAGGAAKCRYVVDELGFDACVDHRAPGLRDALARACPRGVDVYFENVGGAVQQAIWPLLNDFARVPVCGLIAQYNDPEPPPGPSLTSVLTKRLTVRGFIVSDHADRWNEFYRDASAWVREGRIKYREDVVEGLERAPEAFIGLLQGRNFGKLLVRVSE